MGVQIIGCNKLCFKLVDQHKMHLPFFVRNRNSQQTNMMCPNHPCVSQNKYRDIIKAAVESANGYQRELQSGAELLLTATQTIVLRDKQIEQKTSEIALRSLEFQIVMEKTALLEEKMNKRKKKFNEQCKKANANAEEARAEAKEARAAAKEAKVEAKEARAEAKEAKLEVNAILRQNQVLQDNIATLTSEVQQTKKLLSSDAFAVMVIRQVMADARKAASLENCNCFSFLTIASSSGKRNRNELASVEKIYK